ncbi:MAG: ABC transporter permease, partial [Pseudomonadota bacterium]
MTRPLLAALMSHWRRQPLQLATLLVGLALATALFSAVQAINRQSKSDYAAAAATLGGGEIVELHHRDGADLRRDTYAALRRAGWQVTPVLEIRRRLADTTLTFRGVDPVTSAPALLPPAMLSMMQDAPDRLMIDGQMFAAPETLPALSETDPALPDASLRPGFVVADISVVAALAETPDRLSYLILLPDQRPGLAPLKDIAPHLIERERPGEADIARLTSSFHLNLTAFGLLSFAVGLFIVHAAIGLAFEQRRPLIRTLRALGAPISRILAMLAIELGLVAVVAGGIGLVLGYFIAAALLPGVAGTLRGLYGAPASGTLDFDPVWALGGLALAFAGTAVAAASGLWTLGRMPLLASAQPRAWSRVSVSRLKAQALAGAALLALGLVVPLVLDGLLAGFALLGGLLMGAALCLPAVLSGLLGLAGRLAKGPEAQWFWADSTQQLRGLSLALMALLLALATNIGVGSMVGSFRLTFEGWLDQRLASELYVTARTEEEATRLRDWLPAHSDAVLPIWSVSRTVLGAPAEIYGVADHATYREHWPILRGAPDLWERVHAGTGALVNEQLFRRNGLRLGQNIDIAPGWTAEVVGMYSDYGNPAGQVVVSTAALEQQFPDLPRLRHGIRTPVDNVPALTEALVSEFGLDPAQMVDQASIKAVSLRVFERTFAVTGALN